MRRGPCVKITKTQTFTQFKTFVYGRDINLPNICAITDNFLCECECPVLTGLIYKGLSASEQTLIANVEVEPFS